MNALKAMVFGAAAGLASALSAPAIAIDMAELRTDCDSESGRGHEWELQAAYCVIYADLAADDEEKAFAWLHSGNALEELERYGPAIADYSRAIELKPDYYGAWLNRGLAKRRSYDIEGALADYEKAMEIDPTRPDAYNNRGSIRMAMEDHAAALADFERAVERAPGRPDLVFNRGFVRQLMGDSERALSDYDLIVAQGAEAEEWINLSMVHYRRGEVLKQADEPAAVRAFETALAHNPELSASHYYLAELRGFGEPEVRDLGKALDHADAFVRMRPDNVQGLYLRALLLAESGDVEASIAAHRAIIDTYAGYAPAYLKALEGKGYLDNAPEYDWTAAAQQALENCVREGCEPFE